MRVRLVCALASLGLFLAGCPESNTPGGFDAQPDIDGAGGDVDAEPGQPDAPTVTIDAEPPGPDAPPPQICGNGVLEPPEQCDDGNTDAGDGCDAACDVEPSVCGDLVPTVLEPGATLDGTTDGLTSATSGTCGGGSAGEQVFLLTVYELSDVTITTDLAGTAFDTAVYVRSDCLNLGSQLACEGAGAAGDTLTLTSLPPGTYFVFVDGVAGASGAFQIQATVTAILPAGSPCDPTGTENRCEDGTICEDLGAGPVCATPGDICAATAIPVVAGTTIADTTSGEADDYQPSCGFDGASGDLVYSLELTGPADITAVVTPTNYAADGFNPIVDLVRVCGDPTTSVDCSSTAADASELVTLSAAEAGTWFIVVDGSQDTAGEFTLEVTVLPVLGEGATCDPDGLANRCDDGLICFDAGGGPVCTSYASICDAAATSLTAGVEALGSTAGDEDLYAPSCSTDGAAGDTVFKITAPGDADLIATVTPTNFAADSFDPILDVTTTCGDTSTAVDCADSPTASAAETVTVLAATAGTYYLVVDGYNGAEGEFSIVVSFRPVLGAGATCDPAEITDRCAAGLDCLDDGAGAYTCQDPFAALCASAVATTDGGTISGTIAAGTSDFAGSCAGGGDQPEDLYYIDLAAAGYISVTQIASTLGWGSVAYVIGPDSCNPALEVDCDTRTGGINFTTGTLPAGRYYIVVDGTGTYELAIDVGVVIPPGGACDPAAGDVCADGTYCIGGVCSAVTVITDAAPNADFCDAQGPTTGDFIVVGSMTGTTDWDTFEVTLGATASLYIETSDGAGGCTADTLVDVYAAGGLTCAALDSGSPTPIATDDDGGVSPCSLLDPAVTSGVASLAPGTYYVRVTYGGGGLTGGYTLLVDFR